MPAPRRRSTKIRIAFAANGSHAVILREGPAKWTRMFSWDTRTDVLTPGQWIHSAIPWFRVNSDASLVLCFVQSYRRAPGTWVALSRPPWFTALAIWHVGDSWGGRCEFVSDLHIHVTPGLQPLTFEGELQKGMRWTSGDPPPLVVSTMRPALHLELRRLSPKVIDSQLVVRRGEGEPGLATFEDVHHAGLDSAGRVVFTRRDGKIYRWSQKTPGDAQEVFDLSEMTPEAIDPPPHATKW